jgi:transcriptional regulator with XRE-family HTH domain
MISRHRTLGELFFGSKSVRLHSAGGNYLEFGRWLAERRHLAGVTQRQLAKKCGLSAGYLALLERGTSEPPPLETCKRLARALGLSWEEVRQRAFSARLKSWLKKEGYLGVSEARLVEIIAKIESDAN